MEKLMQVARDITRGLRIKLFGKTRAEIRRDAALLESRLRAELSKVSEELRILRAVCQSKESTIKSLESDNLALRKQVSDKTASMAFNGFLAQELKQQVLVQRDMIARHKVIDEIVDCIKAGDRPGEAILKRALGIGEAGGAVAADPIPLDKRTRSNQAKSGRRSGANRKPGKGAK